MTELYLNPEYLESKGFIRVTGQNCDDLLGIEDFCDAYTGDDVFYVEKDFDRNQIGVLCMPRHCSTGEKWYRCTVYVRNDIGCGATEIPSNYSQWTCRHFELLYEGIRRQKLSL